ncbi:hypothetical protein ACHAXN_003960 [Cyclotella atomus]
MSTACYIMRMLSISYSDSNNWPHHSQQGKTRIMTTTTGKSLIPRLKQGASMRQLMAAFALENAIATYSTTKNDNGISIPHEVVYGLQVLGAPIGFLVTMYPWRILKMRRSVCTAHKVTHLFSHAVYNTSLDDLPNNFWLWDSPMTTQLRTMTSNLMAQITNANTLPPHAQLMAHISINKGGLGIQLPVPMPLLHI